MEMVENGIEYIEEGQLSKIVLSWGIEVWFQKQIDIMSILQRLYYENPSSYTYALKTMIEGVLIGASPEMLVAKTGQSIYSNPLAESRPRGKNMEEDICFA